ncbi:hypothetical protein AC628_00120 [Bradyrhizobium sp. NAS96.2]|nr:hypothetical protein AC628_00120 [Bradyrhizobium sp. NAS96.2]
MPVVPFDVSAFDIAPLLQTGRLGDEAAETVEAPIEALAGDESPINSSANCASRSRPSRDRSSAAIAHASRMS